MAINTLGSGYLTDEQTTQLRAAEQPPSQEQSWTLVQSLCPALPRVRYVSTATVRWTSVGVQSLEELME